MGLVMANPKVARNAYQRLYDMILSHGVTEYTRHHERYTHYRLFDDPLDAGRDAVFGLDAPLMRLVNNIKSAAFGYGTEKRILLLHGPVGSSKSTIARLLKKGLESYSGQKEGALYTFGWRPTCRAGHGQRAVVPDARGPAAPHPLREPGGGLRGAQQAHRPEGLPDRRHRATSARSAEDLPGPHDSTRATGRRSSATWWCAASCSRRRTASGIGTFQPKDEKNQDSTELTGDLNYRKIAEYGSDSDPRAFNFDGEFNVANRGIIEFIEILKLDVAFLYDLLGASQEHKIKPKKFAQTDIDEVHPRPHQRAGVPEAPEQRAHGGVPRPHGQDRHPVQHASGRTRSRSTAGTSTTGSIRASTSRRTRSRWRRCGPC